MHNLNQNLCFRKDRLEFIRLNPKKTFPCNNPNGLTYITRLRLGLSHLRDHKLIYSFQGTLNPFL